MLILSWNVAGLSTTLERIRTDYSNVESDASELNKATSNCHSSLNSSKNKNNHDSKFLANYLHLHGADIVCFQEHKIPLPSITNHAEPYLCCTKTPGFESFWSCCVDQNKRGFNGVCTFVKTGMTVRADRSVLGEKDLDDQGRCIMTDHGAFVLFNVYVPALGGQSLTYKMRFLNALRRAMITKRKEGKYIILVGDLNIAHTKNDIFWSSRLVDVDQIIQEVEKYNTTTNANNENNVSMQKWKIDLHKSWEKITTALKTKKAVPVITKNIATGAQFQKYRISVKHPNTKQEILLGKAEESDEYAMHLYDFSNTQHSYFYDADLKKDRKTMEANFISIRTLTELMAKICNIHWEESTQRLIANTHADVNKLSPGRDWLNKIIEEDGMVDMFRYFYPDAKDRFTCWNQQTNSRYLNVGARIDYTFVDKNLIAYIHQEKVSSLRCCTKETLRSKTINYDKDLKDSASNTLGSIEAKKPRDITCLEQNQSSFYPLTEEAAYCAATANGAFQGASYLGGGISNASKIALDTQFGPKHTGIIYTPPTYSDHVGVSLLLKKKHKKIDENITSSKVILNSKVNNQDDDDRINNHDDAMQKLDVAMMKLFSRTLHLDEKDTKTKKTQPFKAQRSIMHFFSNKRAIDKNENGSSKNNSDKITSNESIKRKISSTKNSSNKKGKKNTIFSFYEK